MSENEEENFCFYGKALDPYDEDLFPKKRPISVEEQIATDSHGRRRFHGAFTGGFSAGFFNTVGSLEGWTPSEFKSGRSEKQKHITQNPEDFMDDEDMGEFGFAPQAIRATKDYDTTNKRKRKVFSDGPIPGEPVLHTLFTAGNETIGYLLLRNIGIKEKMKIRDEEVSDSRIYGCEMPKASEIPETLRNRDYKLPEIYEGVLLKPKNDSFGLGYVGLDRNHITFTSTDLVVHEKDKKLSVRGQAFGVGAFENEDDDIYSKEDMSNYDFEITKEQEIPVNSQKNKCDVFDIFHKAKINSFIREIYSPPVIPKSFTGKHKVKKSRFEALVIQKIETVERSSINPIYRAEMLDEEINKTFTDSKKMFSKTNDEILSEKKEPSSDRNLTNEPSTSDMLQITTNKEVQNKSVFDTSNIWNDRFVSALQDDDAGDILAPVKKYDIEHYTKEMRDAAKMKMFGPLTRISDDWQPCSLLCKRFNIPEPLSDKRNSLKDRSRTKNLVFEYQKHQDDGITLLKPGLSSQNLSVSSSENHNIIEENNEGSNLGKEVKQESEIEASVSDKVELENLNKEMVGTNGKNEDIIDIEQVVDITDKLNIEEKGDIFKAIFLSSSESEGEAEEDEKISRTEEDIDRDREIELRSNVLGDELILPKIKPVKVGILSGLDFKLVHQFKKPSVSECKEEINENKVMESNMGNSNMLEPNVYGPKLPEKIIASESPSKSMFSFNNLSDSSDEWVEKEEVKKIKKKKHKKDKSHKKKHKQEKKKKNRKRV